MGFPDPAVVRASERLVSEHQGKYSQTSRILQQVTLHLFWLYPNDQQICYYCLNGLDILVQY